MQKFLPEFTHVLKGERIELPWKRNVMQLWESNKVPPQQAVVIQDGVGFDKAALDALIRAHLKKIEGLGLKKGDRVLYYGRPSVEQVAFMCAGFHAGLVYVPVDAAVPTEKFELILGIAAPKLIFHDPNLRLPRELPGVAHYGVVGRDKKTSEKKSDALGPVREADDAAIIFTSGSTGVPKGVRISHGSLINRLHWAMRAVPVSAGERTLSKTSLGFVDSLTEIMTPLFLGGTLVIERALDPRNVRSMAACIEDKGIQRLTLTPTVLRHLLGTVKNGRSFRELKLVVSSGENLGADVVRAWTAAFPDKELLNLYGCTEGCGDSAFLWVKGSAPRTRIGLGGPIQNTSIGLVPSKEAGTGLYEAWIGGKGISDGYLGAVGALAPEGKLAEGAWFKTGDLMSLKDGCLFYEGRLDRQVKVMGQRIEIDEVAQNLRSLEAIDDALVSARLLPDGGTQLVAQVVVNRKISAQRIKESLRKKLSFSSIPSEIEVVKEILLNDSGKAVYRPQGSAQGKSLGAAKGPATLENKLASLWEECFPGRELGERDDFFGLGGDSILAVTLVTRINEEFGSDFSFDFIFDNPSIAAQMKRLSASGRGRSLLKAQRKPQAAPSAKGKK